MHDGSIPTSRLVKAALWTITSSLLIGAWLTAYLIGWREAQLLGYTACVSSAAAAVAHIRCYMLRMSALIKLYGRMLEEGASRGTGSGLRSIP